MNEYIEYIDCYQFLAPNYSPNKNAVLSTGKGALIWDTSGKCYIDLIAGYSAANMGHNHPRILAALVEQAGKLTLCPRSFCNDKLGIFAKELCSITGLDMVLPSSSGVESVETAIKIARKWGYEKKNISQGNAKIIVFEGNFHGRTSTVVGFSSDPLYKEHFDPHMQGFHCLPYGDFDAIEKELNTTSDYCAVLVEPIQGEAGVIIPPKGWLKHIEQLCRKHKVLLIVDEIQSGLGRCGYWFAFERENVIPDLILVGKSLGGGMLPISAVIGKHDVMEVITLGTHGSTFGGNPLAAAIATESLKVLEEDELIQKSWTLGFSLQKRLYSINNPLIKEIRCMGLWAGIELDISKVNILNFCNMMFAKGVIMKEAHNSLRISPPLVITQFQLNQAIDKLEETLKEVNNA